MAITQTQAQAQTPQVSISRADLLELALAARQQVLYFRTYALFDKAPHTFATAADELEEIVDRANAALSST